MAGRFTVDAVFRGVDKFSGPMARMTARAEQLQKRMAKGTQALNNASAAVASGLKTAATYAIGAGAIVGTVAAKVIEAGANFESTMSGVAAVSNATDTELAALKGRALELGKTTKFSATEVAGGMEIMSKAGLKVSDILTGLPGLLSAAAADGAGIEETANSLMSSMKAMGIGPEKMQLFADQMAKAGDATKASIGSISESLAIAGPVFKQLNVPMESAIAQIALLQDAGIDASSAGTTLAAAYSKLAAPMGRTKGALAALGLSVKDAMGNMKPPERLLGEILGATSKIKGNVGQMAAFTELVGLESQKALLNVASAAKDGRLTSLVSDLKDAGGYADTIAKKRLDNFTGDITMLGSAVEGVSIKLFDMEKGPLRGVVKGITDWVRANDDLIVSGIGDKLKEWKPIVTGFGEGLRDGMKELKPILKDVGDGLSTVFGNGGSGQGPQAQAYFLAKNVVKVAEAFALFSIGSKLASVGVAGIDLAVKGAKVVGWMWDVGKSTKAAVDAFRTAQQVGPASITALSNALNGLNGGLVDVSGNASKVAGLRGGLNAAFDGWAAKAGLAAAAIGAVGLALEQGNSFLNENGGWEGFKAFVGAGDDPYDYGFSAVDNVMNKQARASADAERASGVRATAAPFDPNQSAAVDRLFGVAQPEGYGAPLPSDARPQVASPWEGFSPDEMKGLFKSTIDVNIKDPGKVVDSVEVTNPGKTLAPVNPRSGTK